MKEPLRVPFESSKPDLAGPRLVHEADGGSRQAVPSFCTTLREARQRGGYSLADAARVLRIQEHYLEALEDGRFNAIPGTTYAIGFLRSYAGFLNLDPDEIVDAFKREQGLDTSEQRLAFPSPSDSSPKPKFWLVLLVLVLAGLAYGGWQYQSTDGQIATDLVADVSTRLTEAVGLDEGAAPEGEAAGATASPEAEPAPAATAQEEPASADPGGAVTAEATPAAADQAPDEAAPAAETAAAPTAAEPAPIVEAVVEPSEPAAPAQAVEAPVQAEPAAASAATTDPRPAVSAPLDLAAATASESSAGAIRSDEAAGDAAAGGAPAPAVEPMVDAAPEEVATSAAVEESETLASLDTAYVPKVYGRSNLDARVVITATDDSWVQVQGPDNELLLTRILHAGDSYRVPDRPGLVMVTGNAGGLEVRVDDALAPALGPMGVVIRNIALEPERLQAGTATGR